MEQSLHRITLKPAALCAELNAIQQLDRASCISRWRKVHKTQPPPHLSLQFMRKALLFEAQAKVYGGLSKPVQRTFKYALYADGKGPNAFKKPNTTLKLGTHLVREWNGKTYRVEVMETNFRMKGREFASLSAIAKYITGAHWSGPRFFGLGA